MKTNLLKPIFAFLFATILFISCDREDALNQGSDQEEEQVIESASISEEATDDVLEIASSAEIELVAERRKIELRVVRNRLPMTRKTKQ